MFILLFTEKLSVLYLSWIVIIGMSKNDYHE